ncbi:MAG: hypothetical protein R3Y11_08685 [Pseudomonadota bacterium]
MSKSVFLNLCGVTVVAGVLTLNCGLGMAAILDSVGLDDAKAMQSASTGSTGSTALSVSSASSIAAGTTGQSTTDIQNATGGAVIDGVGSIPVGASVPDMKMQEVGTSQAVATDAGTVQVIERSCTSCHTMAPVCAAIGKKDGSQWAVTVQKMVTLGADLGPSEQAAVTGYLAGQAPNSAPLCK